MDRADQGELAQAHEGRVSTAIFARVQALIEGAVVFVLEVGVLGHLLGERRIPDRLDQPHLGDAGLDRGDALGVIGQLDRGLGDRLNHQGLLGEPESSSARW